MAKTLGILGRKVGMTRIFGDDGSVIPVTVIAAGPCPVLKVKTSDTKDGYNAIQVGFEQIAEARLTKPARGDQAKAGSGFFRHLKEFRIEGVGEYAVGQELNVGMFAPGDKVKVTGTSIGKGYQGPMKRHNMAGANATHGAEKVHRSGGSIGNNTFPGKVWKGKRMAGQMGNKQVTVINLEIVDVLPEDNVILVKGQVPGARNGLVVVRKTS